MIRYICKSYLRYFWMVRLKIFYPSLDRLSELAINTYPESSSQVSSSEEFSRILQSLKLNSVWKWTRRNRLKYMDRLLSECLASQGWKKFSMLDIGASDGITALDTIKYLQKTNQIFVSMTMIDRNNRLLFLKRNRNILYFMSDGRPILIRFGKFALCLEPMEGIEGLLFNKIAAMLAKRYADILNQTDIDKAGAISMINPAVARCPFIKVCERDLFDQDRQWFEHFDVVRASNVLTRSYYSDEKIHDAIGIAYRYLKQGGILVISRNLTGECDDKEIGGLWQKKDDGFIRYSSLEELPEIAGMIDRFRSGSLYMQNLI